MDIHTTTEKIICHDARRKSRGISVVVVFDVWIAEVGFQFPHSPYFFMEEYKKYEYSGKTPLMVKGISFVPKCSKCGDNLYYSPSGNYCKRCREKRKCSRIG